MEALEENVINSSRPEGTHTLHNHANSLHLKQKRARSQLSCTPCRAGKLKCNREKPACDQCVKRARDSSCVYVAPPAKTKPVHNVKGRIRQLEDLVVDLMNQNRTGQVQQEQQRRREGNGSERRDEVHQGRLVSQPTPPSDSDVSPQYTSSSSGREQNASEKQTPPAEVDAATTPFGQMKISKDEISYVGEGHWNALLNSISDLKRELGDDEGDEEEHDNAEPLETNIHSGSNVPVFSMQPPHSTTGLGFMLGSSPNGVTQEQLIASVPEKRVADRLLNLWFNSPDPFKSAIHAPTFQDEYRRFWSNPKETPTMWLGLFFAIMSLAASFGLRDVDPESKEAQTVLAEVNRYHSLASSAAVLADFTKPKQYTLECLIAYAGGLRSNNAFVNVWLMIGLLVRLALRMGYHRDPRHYPKISVFHGEMRRRVWAAISMVDVLISFQLGLPSIVRTIQSDTEPPRNLFDRDFNAETTVLPPARSLDELTPCSYPIAKLRIIRVFADANELNHATVQPNYEDVMELDRKLEEAKAAVPPILRMPDISEVVTDPAEQLMCRFNLDLLYLKTKIVLHRRYMLTPLSQLSAQEQAMGIGRSRKVCIESALRVLNHHHTIYQASQPGGQLESVKWYMGSISTHDFLLAAMVICLELSQQIHEGSYQVVSSGPQCPKRLALIDALEKSHAIWANVSRKSGSRHKRSLLEDAPAKGEFIFDETEKAARAMAVMLEKVKQQFPAARAELASQAREAAANWTNYPAYSPGQPPPKKSPFGGVVPMFAWDGMEGVPEPSNLAKQSNGALLWNADGFAPGPFTAGLPESALQAQPVTAAEQPQDYPMIGDMLDFNAANIDWAMWDSEMLTGQGAQGIDWSDGIEASHNYNVRYDNMTRVGAQDSLPLDVVPGNAMIPGGTGPGSKDMFDVGDGSKAIYNPVTGVLPPMNGTDMDVSFDLDPAQYNRYGLYPTPAG